MSESADATGFPPRPPRVDDYGAGGDEIYRRSFATIRDLVDLTHLPADLEPVVARLVHGAGDPSVAADVAASDDVVASAREALRAGAPVFTDSLMLAAGVTRSRLPADNVVECTLRDPRTPELARAWGTTRAAAAVGLWTERLEGAVVAIGNAPTALFQLLELVHAGGPRPAAIVGVPVGFIGSAESKQALAEHVLPDGATIPWITLHGRRGGSAIAASIVNALATPSERT